MNLFLSCILTIALTVQTALAGPITPGTPNAIFADGAAGGLTSSGCAFSGSSGAFTIVAGRYTTGNTAGHYNPFYKNGSLYQVSAGKTAHCGCGTAVSAAGTTDNFQYVSATATFNFDAASLTGGVYETGTAAATAHLTSTTASIIWSVPGTYDFAASTWPGVYNNNAQSLVNTLICIEQ